MQEGHLARALNRQAGLRTCNWAKIGGFRPPRGGNYGTKFGRFPLVVKCNKKFENLRGHQTIRRGNLFLPSGRLPAQSGAVLRALWAPINPVEARDSRPVGCTGRRITGFYVLENPASPALDVLIAAYEAKPNSRSCSAQFIGMSQIRSARRVIPWGCVPAAMASMILGLNHERRSSLAS